VHDQGQLLLGERKGLTVEHERQQVDRLHLRFVQHVQHVSRAPRGGVLGEPTLDALAPTRLEARGHELDVRLSEHLVLRPVERARETAVELRVQHVHGLARAQPPARFEQLDRLVAAQAGHLEVEHPEPKRVAVRGPRLGEERMDVPQELAHGAHDGGRLHERRPRLAGGRGHDG
jgi:hypothetical protein